jgi:hypothetical protein
MKHYYRGLRNKRILSWILMKEYISFELVSEGIPLMLPSEQKVKQKGQLRNSTGFVYAPPFYKISADINLFTSLSIPTPP